MQSAVWTVVAGAGAIGSGLYARSAVLVAFGAVSFVDALGSAALAYHFHHGLRHDALSQRLERIAHRIVALGLCLVGGTAVVGGTVLLATGQESEHSAVGTALAAASLVVLTVLSRRKRSLATRVSSPALRGDSHLSAVGAAEAAVTLVGSVVAVSWADPLAAIVIGGVALVVGLQTRRGAGS